MHYKWIYLALCSLLIATYSFADTVYLKNGRSFKTNVVKKQGNYTIVEEKGFPNKYYDYEIDRIESDNPPEKSPSSPMVSVPLDNMDKKGLILRLLTANGTKSNLHKNFDSVLAQAEGEKKEKLKEILDIDKITDMMVPVYEKYFTEEDLKEMVRFYESPTGQKFLQTGPMVLDETVQASIQYFKDKQKDLDQLK